jgi:hypothetical protein
MGKYIIVKKILSNKFHSDGESHYINIIMNDSLGEVEEFDSEEQVNKMVELLNANTDSGYTYFVRKIVD